MAPIDNQHEDVGEKKMPSVTVTRSREPPTIGPRVPVSNLVSHWWQEFVAAAIAVLTLLGLMGLLLYFHIKQQEPIMLAGISLNAIVSIFTTVIKAAVIVVIASGIGQLKWVWFSQNESKPLEYLSDYDSATRGSLGAAWLLWRLKKSDLLASCGALIIILALGLEPLAQQIIKHTDCRIYYDNDPAEINRTSRFEVNGTGPNSASSSLLLPQELQDILRAAVLNPTPFTGYNCTSGNCTWSGNYSTLGWCSACEDMSSKLIITNSTYSIGSSTFPNLTSTLPDSMLSVNWTTNSQQLAAMSPSYAWETSSNATYSPPGSISIDFIVGKRPEGGANPSTGERWPGCPDDSLLADSWDCKGSGASRCSLTPCVKTYDASVDYAEFYEEPLLNSSNWLYDPNSRNLTILDASTSCLTEKEQAKLITLGHLDSKSNLSAQWLPINYLLLPAAPSLNLTLNATIFENCTYTLQQDFLNNINRYFATLLNGGMYTPGDTRQILGSDTLKGLYNGGNVIFEDVEWFFANVSMALEGYIRTNGLMPYNVTFEGINEEDGVCIEVRWGWIAFPSGLVLATLLFFVAMVLKTWPRVGGPEIWKSSPLAYMFNALTEDDDEDEDEKGDERRETQARAAAAERKGSLVEQAGGRRDMRNMRRVARRTRVKFSRPATRGMMESGLDYFSNS